MCYCFWFGILAGFCSGGAMLGSLLARTFAGRSDGDGTVGAEFLTTNRVDLVFSTYRCPADRFMRVNKSFIVSIAAVDSFDTNDLYIGDTPVAIGASYRDAVLGRLMR